MLASVEERAKRRHEENMVRGIPSNLEQLKEEITQRDRIDSERSVAPLKKQKTPLKLIQHRYPLMKLLIALCALSKKG